MKKTFSIALLVIMTVLAISVVSFAEDITLRVSWWGSLDRNNKTLEVIELFEEKYPNVKIQPEFLGWGDYWDKMAVQAVAKNLPDVFQQSYAYLAKYAGTDLLLNLDPYVENNRLDLTSTDETEISGGRFNDKLYGVNLGTAGDTYVYDAELFKKAGVEEPTSDWTWEDYIEKAKKIHDALGIYADDSFPRIGAGPEGFTFYLVQHGETFYDKSGKKLGYEDDNLFVDYYTMIVDLVKDGVNAPAEISIEITALEDFLITRQESAMVPLSSNQIVAITKAAGRPLSMVIWPNAKDQVQYGTNLLPSMLFSVAKNSKYPEWAVKFVDFFTNNLEANKILLAERGIPISSKIREAIKPYLGDAQKKMFDYMDIAIKHSSPAEIIFPKADGQIRKLIRTTYEKILYGVLTVEKAAKEFREKANEILAED